MTREEHLRAVHIVGSRTIGKGSALVLLCSGPECAGAEMLARPTAGDVYAEACAHIDKMADLASCSSP